MKDRFIWIKLDYQTPEEEILIITKEAHFNESEGNEIAQISQEINELTRKTNFIMRGSSIRGAIDLADIILKAENHKSSKAWVEAAIMSLYNKIELEDGVTRSKSEIITDIVLSVLNKTDFQ